jgi:hypothetical protein
MSGGAGYLSAEWSVYLSAGVGGAAFAVDASGPGLRRSKVVVHGFCGCSGEVQ